MFIWLENSLKGTAFLPPPSHRNKERKVNITERVNRKRKVNIKIKKKFSNFNFHFSRTYLFLNWMQTGWRTINPLSSFWCFTELLDSGTWGWKGSWGNQSKPWFYWWGPERAGKLLRVAQQFIGSSCCLRLLLLVVTLSLVSCLVCVGLAYPGPFCLEPPLQWPSSHPLDCCILVNEGPQLPPCPVFLACWWMN